MSVLLLAFAALLSPAAVRASPMDIKETVDNFTSIGANNVTNATQLPNVLVNTTLGAIVNATAKVAENALLLHATVTAPLVGSLASGAAPILRLDSNIAAPLIVAGGGLTQPLVIGAIQNAGPLLKLGQIGLRQVNDATAPFTGGFNRAVQPLTDALKPLDDATQPIRDAKAQAFPDVPAAINQTLADNVQLEQSVDDLKKSVNNLVTLLAAFANQQGSNSTA